MALWGKTDANGSKPKYVNLTNYPAGSQLIFVDATEAAAASNKSKGITGPGWWIYSERVDSSGATRYYAEQLVFIKNTTGSGDAADDLFVPDASVTIAFTVQPVSGAPTSGNLTFTSTAVATPGGTVTYQWQRKLATQQNFSNLSGQTASSLALTGLTGADVGVKYRVKAAGAGAKAVLSNVVEIL
jgi:hypothetical protein